MSCTGSNLFFLSTIHLLFYFAPSASDTLPSICQYTPIPSLCKSVLPTINVSANIHDYGRLALGHSLSNVQRFSSSVEKYLSSPSTLSTGTIRALQDCQLLYGLNMDFLSTTFQTVNNTQTLLEKSLAENLLTILSAVLTNTQTCVYSLDETAASWSSINGALNILANDSKLFSVSLALFRKGWVPSLVGLPSFPSAEHTSAFRNGQLPLKTSNHNKAIPETKGNRKLLQTDEGDVQVRDYVIVSQDGSGNFTTIMEAINTAPNNSAITDGYYVIFVSAGLYEENVSITKHKKYLMMIGDGINQTVVTGNRSVVDGWTTFNSATFAVVGEGFVAVNMTFQNTAGAIKHQAVAVRNGADSSAFYSCSFEGYQDTLYAHSLRQFYSECDIYGTVDYIFGNAAVVFQDCNIYSRLPLPGQFNTVTAQGRIDPNQNTGTVIQDCTVDAAEDLAMSNGTTETYLGRPWKEYSRTVYMESYMGSLINPAGWSVWSGDFALNTSYYAEFNNTGPGSNTSDRVTWPGYHVIDADEAANFTVSSFLLGDTWLPETGVPYSSGLD